MKKLTKRDPYLDNCKVVLIYCVVLGHYCGVYRNQSWIMLGLYDFIYSFHMPLFVFISGYLSKNITCQRIKDIDNLIIPYVFIQGYYMIFKQFIGLGAGDGFIAFPQAASWYLLGLFLWRLMIPFFRQMKYPIIISIIISLLVGYVPDISEYLALQRIMAFLPFFVLGYFFEVALYQNYIKNVKSSIAFIFLVATLLCFLLICYKSPDFGNQIRSLFIPQKGYSEYYSYFGYGFVIRAGTFGFSLCVSYFVMIVIPKSKTWFTGLGNKTLYIFLFHMFFIYFIRMKIAYAAIISELLTIPLTMMMTLFFSHNYMKICCDFLLNPLRYKFQKKVSV